MTSNNAIKVGAVVSVLVIAAAGALYWLASSSDPQAYSRAADQVRQIQQLASDWSVATARARSDPLADYDALVAFIPEMRRLKSGLLATVRGIPGFPDELANEVSAYASALDAKEERIERFKTANSVIRNSVRYLPIAATNVLESEAADAELSRDVRALAGGLNEYAGAPTDAAKGRLTAVFDRLMTWTRNAGDLPSEFADAVASFSAHVQVLLDRQGPTEEIFQQATASDVSELSNTLVAALNAERESGEHRRGLLMNGVWGAAAALVLIWILVAVLRVAPVASPRSSVGPRAPISPRASAPVADLDSAAPATKEPVSEPLPLADADALIANGATIDALTAAFEKRLMAQRVLVESVVAHIATAARTVAADADALGRDDSAAQRLRQETEGVAELAERLSAASAGAGPEVRYALVDVNDCVQEALRGTGCETVADVVVEPGKAPEVFACAAELGLMLEKVLENSVQAIEDKGRDDGRKGEIRIATAAHGDDATVTIIDNGIGMSAAERERIYEPMYAAREDRAGIGLTITAHLVAKYGGRISVSSHAGAGSVTRIALPGMADAATADGGKA